MSLLILAQLAGAVEYTDSISAEGLDSPNEWPGYDTKTSSSGIPVMLAHLWNVESLFIAITPWCIIARSDNTW